MDSMDNMEIRRRIDLTMQNHTKTKINSMRILVYIEICHEFELPQIAA